MNLRLKLLYAGWLSCERLKQKIKIHVCVLGVVQMMSVPLPDR